jgi:hypothetical protein
VPQIALDAPQIPLLSQEPPHRRGRHLGCARYMRHADRVSGPVGQQDIRKVRRQHRGLPQDQQVSQGPRSIE